ncbi:hypothetical protein GUJ93_ZPchr0008g13129 [Zizania palustris]|uniref:HVA22-like protein n=1 Tax=Zizania palustris TaxID=103762 RepID=A0A8J5RDX8_ZIZPA|nr:hypothetical protein GUJ93_ZPchr0008g13129 [Zizania palustris]
MESPSKVDDEQWLSYWILYSFITLLEMVAEPILYWYLMPEQKMFKGASFIYDKLVREQLRKYRTDRQRRGAAAAADGKDHKVHIAKVKISDLHAVNFCVY